MTPILTLLPSLMFVIVWHELGHLVAGRLVGYRLWYVYVWPLAWVRRGGLGTLEYDASWRNPAGVAGSLPALDLDRPRLSYACMVAGGPGASLLLAGLAWLTAPWTTGWLQDLVLSTGMLSGFVGVLNLVPFHMAGFTTDGLKLLALTRSGSNPTIDLLRIFGLTAQGVRCRDWPAEIIDALLEAENTSIRTVAHYYGYCFHEDGGASELADHHRAKCLENVSLLAPLLRRGMQLDFAIGAAMEGRVEEARELYHAAGSATALVDPHLRPLTRAAIAVAEGRNDDARTALDLAETELPCALLEGTRLMGAELIATLRGRLDHGSTETMPQPAVPNSAYSS